MKPYRCRFDLRRVLASPEHDWVGLLTMDLPAPPGIGTVFNIDGDPYIVFDVAYSTDTSESGGPKPYCYVTLVEPRPLCTVCRGTSRHPTGHPCPVCEPERKRRMKG